MSPIVGFTILHRLASWASTASGLTVRARELRPLEHFCALPRQPSLRSLCGNSELCPSIAHKAIFFLAWALDAGSSPANEFLAREICRVPHLRPGRAVRDFSGADLLSEALR